jgi:hydroxyacylglutathione hydrolase
MHHPTIERIRPLLLAALALALIAPAASMARAEARRLPQAARVQTFTPQAVLEMLLEGDGPMIIDCRNASQYLAGHIPGAINIHHKETWGRLKQLRRYDRDRGMIYYDRKGVQSGVATRALMLENFRRVGVMTGHFEEWQRLGYPVARGMPKP